MELDMDSQKSTAKYEFMEIHGEIGGPFRAAILDFDGTLSLLRQNWQDVMIPMMVEILQNTGTDESPDQLYDCAEEFVMRLNGRQTIYQMIHLAGDRSTPWITNGNITTFFLSKLKVESLRLKNRMSREKR
jgi:hypothetical protein